MKNFESWIEKFNSQNRISLETNYDWFCGDHSRLFRCCCELVGDPKPSETTVQQWQESLSGITPELRQQAGNRIRDGQPLDESRFPRWMAVQSLIAYLGSPRQWRDGAIRDAVAEWDRLWPRDTQEIPAFTTLPEFDPVVSRFGDWSAQTRGDWIAYDAYWHLTYPRPSPDRSDVKRPDTTSHDQTILGRSRVSLVTGSGTAVDFVVERLAGPPGLVTPDWFAMGLTEFPKGGAGKYDCFVESTQKVLTAVVKESQHRFRWRVVENEKFQEKKSPGGLAGGLFGRSAEAAVAIAGLAACEDGRPLDPHAVISAQLVIRPDRPWHEWTFDEVGFLALKQEAAGVIGATIFLVWEHQKLPNPAGFERVADLGVAYERMEISSRKIEAYCGGIRTIWESNWQPERTPSDYRDPADRQTA